MVTRTLWENKADSSRLMGRACFPQVLGGASLRRWHLSRCVNLLLRLIMQEKKKNSKDW